MATVITLDGPTSAGKSSVGLLFSQKIGFSYADSGAIYRAGAVAVLEQKVPLENENQVAAIFNQIKVEFNTINGDQLTYLNGKDITKVLHDPEISRVVPLIAIYPDVRLAVNKIQRQLAEKQNIVIVGRATGTEVFPEAKLKFYLTADVETRAKRRFSQLKEKVPTLTLEKVFMEMIERDKRDSERSISPLTIPQGAYTIDTTHLTPEETVDKMIHEFNRVHGNLKIE